MKANYWVTTQAGLRAEFWRMYSEFKERKGARQNDYSSDVRQAWVDFVDTAAREGDISDALAARATL